MLKQKFNASARLLFLCCAVVCVSKPLFAQASSDQAITPLSVLGTVTELKADTREVVVTTAAGSKVTLTLSDSTVFMRIPPGEKTKDRFIKITATDFGVGDSVYARGRISEDQKTMPAREFFVMSKGEITDKRDREREAWRTRGIAGTITALKPEANEITIDARTAEGPKPIVIAANAGTKYRRYAPNSVRFSDAKSGSFADLSVGDQVRALGAKSSDGARFTPDEIVSGSFQTLTGTINEIDTGKGELKLSDQTSHQSVTVVVKKDSTLRRLTPELLAALTQTPPGKPAEPSAAPPAVSSPAKASGDLQEMFEQLPTLTLSELKVGDAILVSSTKSGEAMRVTAIAVVSGVGPLLQSAQGDRRKAVALGQMSVGGP
jgi:hypothetical protein